jgi:WD40 repeat protein
LLPALVAVLLVRDAIAAPVTALAFSSNGEVFAAASGLTVALYSPLTGEKLNSLSCENERLLALAFQPGGSVLAVGTGTPGEKGGVRLLDWRQQKWLGAIAANSDVVTCVAFSPNGKLLATSSADYSATVYEIADDNARLIKVFGLTGHSGAVQAIAFSPDAQTLLTASADRSLKVWSAADGRLIRSFGQHTDSVHALAFRPTSSAKPDAAPICASGSDDRTAACGSRRLAAWRIVTPRGAVFAGLHSRRTGLFSAGEEGIVRRIDANSDAVLNECRAVIRLIYSLAISPDGWTLATVIGKGGAWIVGEGTHAV